MKIFILVACLFAASSAAENIVQLAQRLGATELLKFVRMAGLEQTLATGGPFTVFAPNNAAFAKVPKDLLDYLLSHRDRLTQLLEYHVVSGNVYSSSLTNEQLAPSLLKTDDGKAVNIRVNIYQKSTPVVTTTGSRIVMVDQNASNGVIHVLDRVMYPVPLFDMPTMVTRERRLSTLLTAVKRANLVSTLAGGPFTLFAPTDEAFAKIPAATLDKLLANVTALTDVLTYHVVSGTVYSAGLSDGEMPKTVEGKTLTVSIGSGGVMINNAKVVEADVAVTNGVIHIIDSVLLPPSFDVLGIY